MAFQNYISNYRREMEQKILSVVGKHPGLSHKELAERLKLDPKTLRGHVYRLLEAGRLKADGRSNGRNGNNYQINNTILMKNTKSTPTTISSGKSDTIAAASKVY